MSGSSARAPDWTTGTPLVDFLQRELAPTPGRLGATLRLTLACTAATVPIMIHHIPHGLVVMIVMYLITKEDTTATVLGSVLAALGVTLGFALALLAWQIALETAWRLVFVFLFAALGLYMARISVLGAIGSAVGVPASMAMVLPDILPVPNVEAMTEFVLWLWWCIVLGLAVNLGVQLLLSPGDPLALLRRALAERLEAVEGFVQRLLGRRRSGGRRPPLPSLTVLTIAGSAEMLTLLKMASLRHAWARRRRPELGALIGLVDQLVTAAAALEAAPPPAPEGDTRARLERMAAECAHAARALTHPSAVRLDEPRVVDPLPAPHAGAIPALEAMERALGEIALAMRGAHQPGPEPAKTTSLLVPDAFSNPEYVRFAVRGGLACLICDFVLVGFNYPGIYTSVITCFVVSLSTIGASMQKGTLRFSGAAVGGIMGIFAMMYILPYVETLGGFWAVFAAGTAVAAWVNFGSPRVSYGGYQIGLAFYKVLLQGWGPVTGLTVARDRMVGIALGLLVFGILERVLWPISASDRREQRFVDVLRSLAILARLGSRDRAETGPDRELDDLRHQVAHNLGETQRLLDESKFELGAGELEVFQRRLGDVQSVFLLLLSLVYHWRTHGRPAPALQFGEAVARHLEALAASHRESPADLEASLAVVSRALESTPSGSPTEETAGASEQPLDLYRALVRLVSQLEPWLASPSRFEAAARS